MTSDSPSPNFSLYPLLWIAASFAAGILLAGTVAFDSKVSIITCFTATFFAAIIFNRRVAFAFITIGFVALGAFCYQIETNSIAENRLKRIYDEGRIESGRPVELEGILLATPEPAFEGVVLTIEASKLLYKGAEQNVTGKVRLFSSFHSERASDDYHGLDLQTGSYIRVACSLEREDRYLNPGVISRKRILDQQGIDATATIKSPLLIEKLGDTGRYSPRSIIYDLRQRFIAEFRDKFSISTAGVMIASLLGDKYFLDKDTAEIFREGGTFHILVISGLHITFIGGLALLLVRLFTRKRLWQFVVTTSFLWAYTLAVGAEVPVVRASLMFTILLFSQVIHRDGSLLNAFGACCLLILAWRPSDLFNPSFQLTTVSVAAIIAMAFPLIENLRKIGNWTPTAQAPFPPNIAGWLKNLCEMLYWREDAWKIEEGRQIWSARLFKSPYLKWLEAKGIRSAVVFIFEGIVVSIVVQLWLLPILVVYFHRVSIASIFLNLWVGVFIALESFAAIFAVIFGWFSSAIAAPLILVTELLNWLLLSVPRILVALDWASFRVPVYSGPMKAIYFLYLLPTVVLAFAAYSWNPFDLRSVNQNRFRIFITAVVPMTVLGIVIIFHPFSSSLPDGRLRIDFLDVGQGDAAFITFPNGETMLVDGGGRINYSRKTDDDTEPFEPDVSRIGEMVVSEVLWERGLSRVDYLVATHADADHIQGLIDVAKNFEIGSAYVGRIPTGISEFDEFAGVLNRKQIPVVQVSRGDVFTVGDVRIELLHPLTVGSDSENNNSVVLRIVHGEREFLLTGDIEKEAEAELVLTPEFLRADVVKVPHHGSRTSSTGAFVDAVNGEHAVISVGRRSVFGHPHEEVVQRWKNSGAETITTGESGMITISTNGHDIEIQRFESQSQYHLR